ALLGVDAETGVFMLLYLDLAYEQARRAGRLASLAELRDAILAGAVKRIRPKVMTVTAISVGLLPVMWSTGIGADTMKRIAAPMVGGVFSSFLMELLVYPAIYEVWKWNFELRPRLDPKRAPAIAEIYDAGEETIIPVEN
ncbi:MAG TPA: efflux RND transporter permease subunit, partial [Blastocatellia bacterium]|nr:efflux RND transporter permease subunit [Blastocatellia bacterium]